MDRSRTVRLGACVSATYNTQGGTNVNSVHYVGMDVDKEKIVVAKLTSTAKISDECVIANTPQAVEKYFAALAKEESDGHLRGRVFRLWPLPPADGLGCGCRRRRSRADPSQALRSHEDRQA